MKKKIYSGIQYPSRMNRTYKGPHGRLRRMSMGSRESEVQ